MKRLAKLLSSLPRYSACQESKSTWMEAKEQTPGKVRDCFFWMDTLCVPVKNQKLREKAIVKMRDVYECASNVLVLDAELMQHSAERDYREIFTRISCSSWLRRLWTLQEAVLNKNLLFQFSDRAIYVGSDSKLFAHQRHDNTNHPWDLVAWECNRYDFDFRNTRDFSIVHSRQTPSGVQSEIVQLAAAEMNLSVSPSCFDLMSKYCNRNLMPSQSRSSGACTMMESRPVSSFYQAQSCKMRGIDGRLLRCWISRSWVMTQARVPGSRLVVSLSSIRHSI